MKRRILCSCVNTDGSKCGRSVTDGSNPPICHIHRNKASGTLAGIAQPAQRTPKEIIEKLLTDNDPTVRLRAVEMWQKHFENRNTDNGPGYSDLVRLLTDDEKAALREALDWIAVIKEAVYARNPDLDPDARTLERRRRREQDERQREVEREATVDRTDALVKSENEPLNTSLDPSADLPTPDNSPVIEPFESLDGQLTANDVRRLYDVRDVEEVALGQFRFTQEEEKPWPRS